MIGRTASPVLGPTDLNSRSPSSHAARSPFSQRNTGGRVRMLTCPDPTLHSAASSPPTALILTRAHRISPTPLRALPPCRGSGALLSEVQLSLEPTLVPATLAAVTTVAAATVFTAATTEAAARRVTAATTEAAARRRRWGLHHQRRSWRRSRHQQRGRRQRPWRCRCRGLTLVTLGHYSGLTPR